MVVSYKKLWKLLIDKDLKRADLKEKANISTNALAKLEHDEPIPTDSMEKNYHVLDCNIGDVMEFVYVEK